jgi:hypothetical protein
VSVSERLHPRARSASLHRANEVSVLHDASVSERLHREREARACTTRTK